MNHLNMWRSSTEESACVIIYIFFLQRMGVELKCGQQLRIDFAFDDFVPRTPSVWCWSPHPSIWEGNFNTNHLWGHSHEHPPHVDFRSEQEREGTNFYTHFLFSSIFNPHLLQKHTPTKPNLQKLAVTIKGSLKFVSSIRIGPNHGLFVQWLRLEVSATSTMLFCICRNISSTKTSSSSNNLWISSRVHRYSRSPGFLFAWENFETSAHGQVVHASDESVYGWVLFNLLFRSWCLSYPTYNK